MRHVLTGAAIFDGTRMLDDHAIIVTDGRIEAVLPAADAGSATRTVSGVLAPAFLDLQVNGGGGLMVDGSTDAGVLGSICATHRRLGCAGVLPTLISDSPEVTARAIAAGIAAAQAGTPGFLGLHLEGPHLDPVRRGAHDPALIRPMTDDDLALLCKAAAHLPALMVTLAPEAASCDQIAVLARAGVLVSLGHSNCGYDAAQAAFAAGARCATHLFNAMSQMGHRAPGLAGAVMAGDSHAGLIADLVHVHPAALHVALAARDTGLFLVSDCMAFAGTDNTEMALNGRRVLRRDGRLTLEDGTLAGADLTLAQAIANLVTVLGIAPERALAMASAEPARALRLDDRLGHLAAGRAAEIVLLDRDWKLQATWSDDDWLAAPR